MHGTAAAQAGLGDGAGEATTSQSDTARGLIVSLSQTVISAEISARVLKLDLREGDRFAAGDTLVAFDCAYFDAQLNAIRVKLDLATQKAGQKRRLADLHSIAAIEVTVAEAEAAEMAAELKLQQVVVDRCILKAPFDGRVVKKSVNVYQSVTAGTQLLEIVGEADLRLRAVIPSLWLAWLRPGSRFSIAVDETHVRYDGVVETIGAAVDPGSQTIAVYGRLTGDTARLIPGMSGTATFAAAGDEAKPGG